MVKERLFTVKELAFIAGYQGYGDGERAAKAAGYGAKCAKGMACELLKKPGIRAAPSRSSARP
jgi:phage terminase small subunit